MFKVKPGWRQWASEKNLFNEKYLNVNDTLYGQIKNELEKWVANSKEAR